jgi:hypothetical protein
MSDDALSYQSLARARIRRGFQQIERRRWMSPLLVVLDDELGAVGTSADIRTLLGDIIEHTHHVHFLILSQSPVYDSLGAFYLVNMPVLGLDKHEAARLFLQRIHRNLEPRDGIFDLTAGAPGQPLSQQQQQRARIESTILQLSRLPLFEKLQGHPGRINAVSARVTPGGPSLKELAGCEDLFGDTRVGASPQPMAAPMMPVQAVASAPAAMSYASTGTSMSPTSSSAEAVLPFRRHSMPVVPLVEVVDLSSGQQDWVDLR